ncbi:MULTISPECIES: metallophosphoesterase [Burkholderia cepacia complex]|uniref:metallophosphoesterase n=1 Tax=Burkholderia cepacia complex TaxID=87882 RepID=UPI0009BF9195|nr:MULTISPECIES: metallophosphoesterase [Burkholderia cepacia complex]MCA8161022.1 metallophosphoesterase [Burkholderia cepacia]CAG9222807.1 Metallophos domain-containing protein [Burkholderia vietnamiensis]
MRKPYRAVRRYPPNPRGRDFVVGDVHGCFSQLSDELARLNFDPGCDRLFSVGDLIDRGPESVFVLDVVRRYRIKAIRGNHEDMVLRWYRGDLSSDVMFENGGAWFMNMVDGSGRARRFASFMASLPYVIEIESQHGLIALVHADAPCDQWPELTTRIQLEGPDGLMRKRLLWQRSRWRGAEDHGFGEVSRQLNSLFGLPADMSKQRTHDPHRWIHGVVAVVVGHTPVQRPTARANVVNIDTGAAYGGSLTVLDLADVPQILTMQEVAR